MKRRHNTSPTLSPALTSGDDQPRGKCADNYVPFDVLHRHTAGPEYDAAKREILTDRLCGGCPLRQACWDDAHKRGEPWFLALRGKPAQRIATANQAKSAAARKKWDDKRAARLADLRELIALDVTDVDTVAARLGCSLAALEKWCRLYARDEWRQLELGPYYRRTRDGRKSAAA